MLRTLRDWLTTILFMVAFAIVMVGFDPAFRVAWFFGIPALDRVIVALQIVLVWVLRLCGTRITVERSAKIQEKAPYIIVSNHQSMFDIPLFGWQFASIAPKYVAKVELARWVPSVSFELRHGGHAIIDRKQRQGAVEAIHKLGEHMEKHGGSAVIFPEGTRARSGTLGPFKPAGTVALMKKLPTVAIVPVCIDGSWLIVKNRMMPIPYGVRLRMWIGDPIERRGDEDPYAVFADAEERIRATMARFRGTEAANVPEETPVGTQSGAT